VEYFDDESLELEVPIDRYELAQELQDLLDDRIKTYNNLAQAQMKLEAWDSAIASLKNVLKIEPNNEKALYRKAKAFIEKGKVDEAIGILRRITRLYPDNKLSQFALAGYLFSLFY
jgi:FK506-binding protein 8